MTGSNNLNSARSAISPLSRLVLTWSGAVVGRPLTKLNCYVKNCYLLRKTPITLNIMRTNSVLIFNSILILLINKLKSTCLYLTESQLFLAVVTVPYVLTWHDARQHHINQLLVNAIKKGDTSRALFALAHGAKGNIEIPDGPPPTLSSATLLHAHRAGKAVPVVHGTPCILVVLGIKSAHWRPKDVKNVPFIPPPPENPKLIRALLAHGADPNVFGSTDDKGGKTTPLLLAVRWRYNRVARLLVSKGAQVNLTDSNGGTPLMWAVGVEDPVSLQILDFLIAHGARINDQDHEGDTALMHAVGAGKRTNSRTIDYLVQHHANVNIRDHQGYTAIMYAVLDLDVIAVRALIRHKANVNDYNDNGTVLHQAYHNMDGFEDKKKETPAHNSIITLLRQAGAKE